MPRGADKLRATDDRATVLTEDVAAGARPPGACCLNNTNRRDRPLEGEVGTPYYRFKKEDTDS